MYLFAINTRAGNGRGQKVWQSVQTELQRRNIAHSAVIMDDAHSAIPLIKQQMTILNQTESGASLLSAIVVIGGDGTIHSLLPLFEGNRIPIGIIPAGSGNDTARTFHIPSSPIAALDHILTGKANEIDLIQTFFPSEQHHNEQSTSSGKLSLTLTAVASGLDSAIAAAVNRSTYKKWCNRLGIGSFAYLIGVFQTLTTYRPMPIEITVDNKLHRYERGWLTAVANGTSYGGGLRICPDADPSDRQLDICILHSCSRLQLLRLLPMLLIGTHTKSRYVTMLRGKRIMISPAASSQTSYLTAYGDGEELSTAPYEAVVKPSALQLISSG
ncbi:MAG: diacylglycerol kinase family protein [Candidatus Pristimantibacillus sp.]